MKREPANVIGRVLVDRAIRLGSGAANDGSPPRSLSARSASTGSDLVCSRCGTVVCESARLKLFSGIVLKCVGCGESNRVPRL